MIKAFYSVKALRQLYKGMSEKFRLILTLRGEDKLDFKDKMFFEICCFGLPLLNDYFSNNLYSIVNYQRYRSIIEASCLLSLNEEKDFISLNKPLFEDQYYVELYKTYKNQTPNFINIHDMEKGEKEAESRLNAAYLKDVVHYSSPTPINMLDKKMPMLLGRDLEESIRYYVGYIFDNIYKRSDEMIHFIDYRDLDDKYSLSFFNDVTRMLMKANSEYNVTFTPKKRVHFQSFDEKSIKSVFTQEKMALKAIRNKIALHYPKSFIVSALDELSKINCSMQNVLLNREYSDINTLFLCFIQWLANVNSVSDKSSELINFNFNPKLDGTEVDSLKMNYIKKDIVSPNILTMDKSKEELVFSYIEHSHPSPKKYYGMKKTDVLKMRYKEAEASTFGSGFLYYAPDRFFLPNQDLFIIMHDLLKELMDKIMITLKDIVDISVEYEALAEALGKKDKLILTLEL